MDINIIGVPMFYGCDRPGVEEGPDTLRKNGLVDLFRKEHTVTDLGNISVQDISSEDKFSNNINMKYIKEILRINENLAESVYTSLDHNKLPLVVGGDHALALGSVAGSGKYFGQDFGVIWVDAHGDINTDSTSPSGNVHGMPLAASMGIGSSMLTELFSKDIKVNSENVFILGARDLDEGEVNLIKEKNLHVWTMNDIKEIGLINCLDELKAKVNEKNINNIHLSFDIDSIDPYFVPGTGTPVDDGLSLDGGKEVIRNLLGTNKIKSIDFVEFNPNLDDTDKTLNNCISLLEEISDSL
ncbi:arginase [Clostridium paraputrificum]|uniref:arginase n=1 Tax=Clostridium paraputrificum TaxID=29363 RepID=UPI003D32EA2B